MRLYKVQLSTEMGWADMKGFIGGEWKTLVYESMSHAYTDRDWAVAQSLSKAGRVVDSRVEEEVDLYWVPKKGAK